MGSHSSAACSPHKLLCRHFMILPDHRRRVFAMLGLRFMFACLALEFAARSHGQVRPCPECVPRLCENVTVLQATCPDRQLVPEPCGCCQMCGSGFGEPCGGPYGSAGICEFGDLICTANPSEFLNGANITGTCTSEYLSVY